MTKEKVRVDKHAYEKPVLTKHGNLKEVTAETRFGSPKEYALGCTRF